MRPGLEPLAVLACVRLAQDVVPQRSLRVPPGVREADLGRIELLLAHRRRDGLAGWQSVGVSALEIAAGEDWYAWCSDSPVSATGSSISERASCPSIRLARWAGVTRYVEEQRPIDAARGRNWCEPEQVGELPSSSGR